MFGFVGDLFAVVCGLFVVLFLCGFGDFTLVVVLVVDCLPVCY